MANEARFVHPQEMGLDYPINTKEELCAIARAINGGYNRRGKIVNGKYVITAQEGNEAKPGIVKPE